MRDLLVAVDVGTGSARAGIFDRHGRLLARADYPIAMNRPGNARAGVLPQKPGYAESGGTSSSRPWFDGMVSASVAGIVRSRSVSPCIAASSGRTSA